jgi:hypothetical protein
MRLKSLSRAKRKLAICASSFFCHAKTRFHKKNRRSDGRNASEERIRCGFHLQEYDFTWYNKFNAKWHTGTETWYMYENNVPNVAGNVANPAKPELGANGAFCAAGQLRCTAPEYAIVNYLNRDVTSKFMIGFRSDLLNDKKGQRTGIPGKYTENTFCLTRYIGSTVMFRPELRFDHSWDREGYNNGTARNQLFLAWM